MSENSTKALTKKQQTRQRILDAASQSFRTHGFAGIGVDGIAKAAKVTSGAFYSHFGSKDGAFSVAIDAGLDEVIAALPYFQKNDGDKWVESFANYYIGKAHRDDLANGCAMTTLSPEVVRAAPEFRLAYEKKMKQIVDIISNGLEGDSIEECRARAWAMLGTLIGGLTLSRAVKNKKVANEIASSIKYAAIAAAGKVKNI